MEEGKGALAQSMIDAVHEMASISGYRGTTKRQCGNLARRPRLLTPLFEEIKDSKESMPEGTIGALASLVEALSSANELLGFGTVGSKIYHLVSEREQIMNKYHEVTSQLEQALNGISYKNLQISDGVKGQVELVLGQLRGAKGGVDSPDVDLNEELLALYNQSSDTARDRTVLRRLAEELKLMKIKQESLAEKLEIFVLCASGGDPGESIERISMLLKKIKDFVKTENLDMGPPPGKENVLPSSSGSSVDGNKETPVIPDHFRCPISLKLMKDPVVVSTGQTYERSCIEKWLEAGHRTCPRTQQTLSSTTLAPNGVLRSLIAQWHEANGIQPPRPPSSSRPTKTISAAFPAKCAKIEQLLCKLGSGNPEEQRSAAGEIRLLAKRNADNRIAIAEAGAIPFLVRLLSTRDSRIQEHAVTALLNLSICYQNKGNIVSSGAVPGIVHVLRNGSMEARENAAATLFSLSAVDEYKVTIGASCAIPPLVLLLDEGTQRGKKDAAAALFNLCIYRGNKGKAVRAGIVPTLMQLLTEPGVGMADEALAVLAILASHTKGRAAIGAAKAVPVLVEIIRVGFPWNKENAAAVLVHLCAGEQHHLSEAKELGIVEPLVDLAQNGTDRGKRKAAQLLERLSRFVEQQQEGSGTGRSRGRGSGTGRNRG